MSSTFRKRFRLNRRVVTVALHDIFMAALSFELSLAFRYWLTDIPYAAFDSWESTVVFAAIAGVVFQFAGLYRGIWHYASVRDLTAIMRAVATAILIFLLVMFVFTRLPNFPRSVLAIQFFLLCGLLAGPRLLYRSWKEGSLKAALTRSVDPRVPVLLIGSGGPAEAFLREMDRNREIGYRVVGILDHKASRQGRDLRGVRVMGKPDDLAAILPGFRREDMPRRIVIAEGGLDAGLLNRLIEAAGQAGIAVARLPKLTDFRPGENIRVQELRPVDVEDLLGRPQKVLDRDAVRRLVGAKRVLVTGAGGTIGAELVRQIADMAPVEIALLDVSEHALYQIDLELGERCPHLPRRALIGDVRDAARVEAVFQAVRPDIVLHAAAYKHVPLTEANIEEAVLTNALGTRIVAEAALRHRTGVMVLISTDKAVNPSNVMGATKRVAEMVAQSLDILGGSDTHFVTVRFGNVLGSSGSVVPLFERQLARGGPLTVTHPDVTRFFMTTREAVELILQAAALPNGDCHLEGKIFVLDMGEPVRIQDLARQMIRLAGLRPDQDVKIEFTGLRPGEKLYEEVLHRAEMLVPTPLEGVLLAAPRISAWEELEPKISGLATAARARDADAALRLLKDLVPEFIHAPQGQDKLGQGKLNQGKLAG